MIKYQNYKSIKKMAQKSHIIVKKIYNKLQYIILSRIKTPFDEIFKETKNHEE